MSFYHNYFSNNFSIVAFDGEGEGDDPKPNPDDEKKFSQAEINAILAKENRKTKEAREQLLTQLEEAKKAAKVGSDERASLEQRIEELQQLTMTAEERARQKEAQLKKQHEDMLKSLEQDREDWKNRHHNLVISNEILSAASTNKACSPQQLLKMMKGDVKLVQKLDEDGKPVDGFEARLDFPDEDKDGKPIVLNLTVAEAVKRMTELPQYQNLFEGGKVGGLGGDNTGKSSGRKVDIAKLAKENPAKYRELRKKHPELLYGSK